MKLTIDHSVIRALLLCAPKTDLRYYLVGVCVDARANGDVVLVTTDGHRMLTYPVAVNAIEALAPGEYIIPREALEAVKPAKAGRTTLPITIDIVTAPDTVESGVTVKGKTSVTITGATSTVTPLIDGKYPDWRRVLPKSTSGEPAQYNTEYVADFGKIAQLMGAKNPHVCINYNGNSPAIVTGLSAAFGVLMPLRADDDAKFSTLPSWALA